jgi:hypothetical protein
MAPVCWHCGHVIDRAADGAWIHDATGWRMCDLSAATFADPHPKEVGHG